MRARPKPSAVIFAKDVARLSRFYSEVIGMTEVHADHDHVILDEGGFQLVIHGMPKQVAAAIDITVPPYIREDTPIKVCLPVESIALARTRAAELGGGVGSGDEQWQAGGFTACDAYDPEGNVFQLRESTS
jgi:predicted enzyme related to lactoylglutathione lyase